MTRNKNINHWLATGRMLLLVIALSFQLPSMAGNIGIKLIMADGTSQVFLLEDEPIAKFKDNMVVISSKTQEVSVSLENGGVAQVIYVDEDSTPIKETIDGLSPKFRITGYGLEANGLKPHSEVCLYDLGGVLISKANVDDDGNVRLPIDGKGIFIIKTSVSTFKIKR